MKRHHEDIIPPHHLKVCKLLMALQLLGLPIWIYGVYLVDLNIMIFSTLWLMVTKAWLVDRMVLLYQDVKEQSPIYQSWYKT